MTEMVATVCRAQSHLIYFFLAAIASFQPTAIRPDWYGSGREGCGSRDISTIGSWPSSGGR